MTNIEDYIDKNRSALDSEELSAGHEFKFQSKLQSRLHKEKSFIIRYTAVIAASIIIFLGSSVYIFIIKYQGYKGAMEPSQMVEFREAEQYYTDQTEKALDKLKLYLSSQPAEVTEPLLSELKVMESSYHQLIRELEINPNDIRLMSAAVQYHQLKLDLINNLIERFTLYTNIKTKNYENEKI